jgi:hypothetical protein
MMYGYEFNTEDVLEARKSFENFNMLLRIIYTVTGCFNDPKAIRVLFRWNKGAIGEVAKFW